MITVLQHHIFYIFYRLFFPIFIPDVLPARYFSKYKKSDLITPLHKILTLRIMGGSYCIDSQFIF